jgi:hypothetical protein
LQIGPKFSVAWHGQYQNVPGGRSRRARCVLARPKSIAALPLMRRAESTNLAGLIADFRTGCKQVGDITMRRSISDYHSLLARAVCALENDDAEAREELYDQTRAALKAEFDKLDPPPSELEFFEERLKLNLAIHDFEWSFEWSTAAEFA